MQAEWWKPREGSRQLDLGPPGAAADFLDLFQLVLSYPHFLLFSSNRTGTHGTRSAQRYTCLLTSWPPIDPHYCQTPGQILVCPERTNDKDRKIGSTLNKVVMNPTSRYIFGPSGCRNPPRQTERGFISMLNFTCRKPPSQAQD